MSNGSDFLRELKRRHVWRVAVAYAVAGWLIVQVATQVFPIFRLPDWTAQFVVILTVIGFPVVVVLAWAFELTPEGIRRTEPAHSQDARAEHDTHAVGRKLNTVIIAVLILAVALLGWRLLVLRREPAGVASVAAQAIPAKSIAVLPFESLSDDKKNDYFVAGMQDLILTKLADVGDLKVISRTSTLQYGSHPENLKTIGEQLGVAVILEGSVQKAGNEVLIDVQLLDVRTDNHIWAQSYQRTLDNVFGVEGDVAGQIATALKAKLSPAQSAQLAAIPTQNRAAYDLFLRAEYQASKGDINYDTASMKAAIPLYRQAVEQAPDFALAYARLSFTESELAWSGGGGEDVKPLHQQARADAERASQLQPDLASAHLAIGYAEYWGRGDYAAALKAFAAALKLKPNDAGALAAQGYIERRQGRFDAAIASLQQALTLDPRNSSLAADLGGTYMTVSRYADAENALQRALALEPDSRDAKRHYSNAILLSTGDIPRALAAAQGDDPALKNQRVTLLTYQRKYREALALLDSIPDTPDNFFWGGNAFTFKPLTDASLHQLMGDMERARPLYEEALSRVQAQIKMQQGITLGFMWSYLAEIRIGLGQTAAGLDAIAKSQKIQANIEDQISGPDILRLNAGWYAQARRPDLAVPLLAKALAAPGSGGYSPVLLWLDPVWDPIRRDSRFLALLNQYAKHRPAVIYDAAPVASTPGHL